MITRLSSAKAKENIVGVRRIELLPGAPHASILPLNYTPPALKLRRASPTGEMQAHVFYHEMRVSKSRRESTASAPASLKAD